MSCSLCIWDLFPCLNGTQKSVLVTCSSTIHTEWQGYTRSLEHAVVITFKWAHATVPFRSDALEKLSTRTQSPHLEPHCPLGVKLQFLLFFFNTQLKPKHQQVQPAAPAKSLSQTKPRSTLLILYSCCRTMSYSSNILWALFETYVRMCKGTCVE